MPPDHSRTTRGAARVVVGWDGSDDARHAADWAAAEAQLHGAALVLVHAVETPDPAATADLAAARGALAAAGSAVREGHAGLAVSTIVTGPPAAASLLDSAGGALLTVVGGWGAGRAPGVPIGSVAFCVASTSQSPVAVVRPEHAWPTRRPVAVAMDGPVAPQGALDFAFAEADRRNVRLHVVHVRHDAAIDGAFPYQVVRDPVVPAAPAPRNPASTWEDRSALLLQLAPWQQRHPRVHVTPVILFGSPAATLLDYSHGTDLLVIGDAGRGVNSGLFLGSTGQTLLHRSACPVVVARSRRDAG